MELKLLTPQERLFEGEVASVTLPGSAGQCTILPGHTFFLSTLAAGKLVYRTSTGESFATVSGGFVEVYQDVVTALLTTT